MLEEPQKVSGICDVLQDEFEVAEDVCQQQTLAFLQGLSDKGLVVVKV